MAWGRGHDSIEGSVERQNPLKGKGHETICGRLCTPGTGEGVENPDWFCQRLEKGNRHEVLLFYGLSGERRERKEKRKRKSSGGRRSSKA